jgi:hypothetical protein
MPSLARAARVQTTLGPGKRLFGAWVHVLCRAIGTTLPRPRRASPRRGRRREAGRCRRREASRPDEP